MKLRSAKRYKVFLRYLLSYVLVLLIPFSLGIGAFYRMSVDLESNLMNDTLGMLDNRVMLLDQRFRELSDFVSQLSLDIRIQEFLSKPSPMTEGSSVWSVVELQQILAPYRLGNTFIYTFHLYFATSRTVLTPFYSFIEIPFFYGPYFRYGTMDAAEWFLTLLDTFHQRTMLPSTELSFYDKSMRALTYIQSIPLNRTALNRGAIVLFIPEDEILLHLADFSDVPGHVIIRDIDGKEILSTLPAGALDFTKVISGDAAARAFEIDVNGRRNTVYRAESSLNGWSYFLVSTTNIVAERLRSITGVMWILLLAAVFMGFLIAYAMAYRNSRPILSLVRILRGGLAGQPAKLEGMADITGSVERLVKRGAELQRTVERQRPLLQATFVERLLRGTFTSAGEIEQYRRQLDLAALQSCIVAAVFRWNDYRMAREANGHDHVLLKTAALRDLISERFLGAAYIYDVDFDRIAALMSFPGQPLSESTIRDTVSAMASELESSIYGTNGTGNVTVGIGVTVESVEEAHVSFDTACSALEYKLDDASRVCSWFADIPAEGNAYYPIELETSIMNAAKAGRMDEIETILDTIYQKNFSGTRLPLQEQRQIVFDIRDTVLTLSEQLFAGRDSAGNEFHSLLERFDRSLTIRNLFEILAEIFELFCRSSNTKKKSHNTRLADRIEAYLRAHYTDPNLYLPGVAAEFGITKEYLSQFFKEQTGANYSKYVENLRIGHAVELLTRGENRSIAEIARQCGYASPQVFRRAFIRVTGAIPSRYREGQESSI